jgi:hypothetical protein
MFPNQDAVNRHVYWTDPVLQFFDGTDLEKSRLFVPHRIIGVTADIDDEHVVPEPILTVYSPFEEGPIFGGRLFIHTSANPYSLVTPVTRIIRDMSADQPIERAATLEDIRAEVLTPDRLNSLVFGVFAAVALAIAVVGVAGVLAFSVSARTREFGIRLALGSEPQRLLKGVIAEGGRIACVCLCVRADGSSRLSRRCCPRLAQRASMLCKRCAPSDRRIDRRLVLLGQMIDHVPPLVQLAALDQSRLAGMTAHRCRQPLPPSSHKASQQPNLTTTPSRLLPSDCQQ